MSTTSGTISALRQATKGKHGDAPLVDPADLVSPRANPADPEHAQWLERTDPNHPDTIKLLTSMRQLGTMEGEPVIVYCDGGVIKIADGDRRKFCADTVNAERAARFKITKDPEDESPLLLRYCTTKDPAQARALGNACRRDDPPMVLARRYARLKLTMKPTAAAAAVGLTLKEANEYLRCLELPEDQQARINARELSVDVAARAAKDNGSAAVEAVIEASKDEETGRVDPAKARAAVKAVVTPRARGLDRDEIAEVANTLERNKTGLSAKDVVALLRFSIGDKDAVTGHSNLLKLTGDAIETVKKARKEARGKKE